MKAAILRQFGTISVEDLPKPEMGDYDALCELVYGATCTGTDSHIIQGCFPFCSPLPTIFGHESTGRVIAVGKKVRHFKEGDLVTRVGTPPVGGCSITWGGFAEYGIAKDHWAMKADGLPASEWTDKRVNQIIPHGINARVAPMFTTWRETLSYLMRLKVNLPGSRVLIMGSGGNGLAFAAHAANEEAEVTVVGATRLQEQVLSKTRTAHYIDYKHSDLTTRLAEHCPQGFDLIIDAIGKNGLVDTVLPCLKPYGTIAAYGIDDYQQVSLNPTRAKGGFRFCDHSNYDEAETHDAVCQLVREGKLDASLWYDLEQPWPLTSIADAFQALWARKSVKALIQLKG